MLSSGIDVAASHQKLFTFYCEGAADVCVIFEVNSINLKGPECPRTVWKNCYS